ncbi:MAG: preprotein translocase subunit SecG [Candidatus Omnitrophota bacterium]
MIYLAVLIVHIIACLVLIAVILLQAGKGGGLSEMFGGGATQNIFGTSATTFLTRATTACAIIFIITSLTLAVLSGKRERSLMERLPAGMQGIPAAQTQGEQPSK